MKNKNNKNSKKGSLLIILGVVLIFAGMTLSYQLKKKNDQQKAQAQKMEEELGKIEKIEPESKTETEAEKEHPKILPGGMDTEGEGESEETEQGDEIYQGQAIGVVRIDKIDVLEQVIDNTSRQALLDGVGLVETTDYPSSENNTLSVLAGHRGAINGLKYFLDLDLLEPGDEIKLTSQDEVLYYQVVDKEVVEETDWSRFTREEDKSKLILMTCDPIPQYDKRLLVKSELVKSVKRDK